MKVPKTATVSKILQVSLPRALNFLLYHLLQKHQRCIQEHFQLLPIHGWFPPCRDFGGRVSGYVNVPLSASNQQADLHHGFWKWAPFEHPHPLCHFSSPKAVRTAPSLGRCQPFCSLRSKPRPHSLPRGYQTTNVVLLNVFMQYNMFIYTEYQQIPFILLPGVLQSTLTSCCEGSSWGSGLSEWSNFVESAKRPPPHSWHHWWCRPKMLSCQWAHAFLWPPGTISSEQSSTTARMPLGQGEDNPFCLVFFDMWSGMLLLARSESFSCFTMDLLLGEGEGYGLQKGCIASSCHPFPGPHNPSTSI